MQRHVVFKKLRLINNVVYILFIGYVGALHASAAVEDEIKKTTATAYNQVAQKEQKALEATLPHAVQIPSIPQGVPQAPTAEPKTTTAQAGVIPVQPVSATAVVPLTSAPVATAPAVIATPLTTPVPATPGTQPTAPVQAPIQGATTASAAPVILPPSPSVPEASITPPAVVPVSPQQITVATPQSVATATPASVIAPAAATVTLPVAAPTSVSVIPVTAATQPVTVPVSAPSAPIVTTVTPPAQVSPATVPSTPTTIVQPAAPVIIEVPVKETEVEKKEKALKEEELIKKTQEAQAKEAATKEKAAVPEKGEIKPEEELQQKLEKEKKQILVGLDTLDQEGGNWLIKRQYLEKTVDKLEDINNLFTKIHESRMNFLINRNKVDREFDNFINEVGFQLGDLDQLLETINGYLNKERKTEGDLSDEERELLNQVEQKQVSIKNLQTEIKSAMDNDASLDDVIMQVEQQISKCQNYQMQAWKNFQMIKKILSDEKAAELYFQTDGLFKNMNDLYQHINGSLFQFFNETVNDLKENMEKIKNELAELKNKGIDLEQEVTKIKEHDAMIEKQRLKEEEEKEINRGIEDYKKEHAVKEEKGWFDTIAALWRYPMQKVADFLHWITGFFGSTEKITVRQPKLTGNKPIVSSENENENQQIVNKENDEHSKNMQETAKFYSQETKTLPEGSVLSAPTASANSTKEE